MFHCESHHREIARRPRRAPSATTNTSTGYPHCWRCHNPVFFAHEQWFIKMDQAAHGKQKTLRQEALEEITEWKWFPLGEDRMYEMILKRRLVRLAPALGACRSSFFIVMRAGRAF